MADDDVPNFADLRPLAEIAKLVGMSLGTAHRWRQDPDTPLRCWRVGSRWKTTEAALRDFISRRSNLPPSVPEPSVRRAHETAMAQIRELGKLK